MPEIKVRRNENCDVTNKCKLLLQSSVFHVLSLYGPTIPFLSPLFLFIIPSPPLLTYTDDAFGAI